MASSVMERDFSFSVVCWSTENIRMRFEQFPIIYVFKSYMITIVR